MRWQCATTHGERSSLCIDGHRDYALWRYMVNAPSLRRKSAQQTFQWSAQSRQGEPAVKVHAEGIEGFELEKDSHNNHGREGAQMAIFPVRGACRDFPAVMLCEGRQGGNVCELRRKTVLRALE